MHVLLYELSIRDKNKPIEIINDIKLILFIEIVKVNDIQLNSLITSLINLNTQTLLLKDTNFQSIIYG
jgi:hypothetical protein